MYIKMKISMFEVFCTINTYVKIPSKYGLRESFVNFPIKFNCVRKKKTLQVKN